MLWEQLREYFEVRFRAEKYGVPYFLAESEAKQSGPRKEAVGARARSGRGFKWKVLRERARRGRNPFKPQTALLHRRPPVGSEWIWRSQTRLRSDFKRTWVRLGERGRRDRFGPRRGESLFSRENRPKTEFFLQKKRTFPRQETERVSVGLRLPLNISGSSHRI